MITYILLRVHTVGTAQRNSAANKTGCPPGWVRCIEHATTHFTGVLNPTIITTSVRFKVRPKATKLTFDLAASVSSTWRVAPEPEAISKATPTSGLQQLQLLLLLGAELTWVPVQIATIHPRSTTTPWRVAGRHLSMKKPT